MGSIADFMLSRGKSPALVLESTDMLAALQGASLAEIDNTISCLNVDEYATCITFLLCSKAKKLPRISSNRDDDMQVEADNTAHTQFLLQVSNLLTNMPTLPTDIREFRKLAELIKLAAKHATACHEAIRLVLPLRTFLLRFQEALLPCDAKLQHGNKYALTPFHSALALVALHAKCYHAALPVLDRPVFEVCSFVRSVDVLEYFYYGGMVYIGMKQFREAAEFLLMAITTPATSLSAIVVEAFKKYVLVYLMVHGDVPVLPKATSVVVSRGLHAHAAAYEMFATVYKTKDLKKVVDCLEAHAADFAKSDNLGLAKQSVEALKRQRVHDLTATYTTVSLSKVAAALSVSDDIPSSIVESERSVLDMIRAGAVTAKMDKTKEMVVFEEDTTEDHALLEMQAAIQKTVLFTERLRAVDVALTKSSKFIGKTKGRKHPEVDAPEDRWAVMNQLQSTGASG
ncbi:COP9 signalosome complex subunit 3 [Achlya hypogyna]|uniref:COP9 signalosome complex subunit 3 n=1 Tax=Achlya hypogyna TaxID=1202772 RepID=A0A1V9Z209_ACHHY|nr:COP9 signalosome complex subunit 3 [Achlya hypogyna]